MGKIIEEIKGLQQRSIDTSNLRISLRVPVVTPYHKKIDELQDSTNKIGTTKRGIGPAYSDKINRVGFRISDILNSREYFEDILKKQVDYNNRIIREIYNDTGFDYNQIRDQLIEQAEFLQPYLVDTSHLTYKYIQEGKRVLFEGAQGTLLDIDHGTYPYVTSSNPTAGGACVGSGIGPTLIDRVIGVAKAYTTRVGEGPFPTELGDSEGEVLRERGAEYGTTTGRARRCGWIDTVILRYAIRINGITDLAITKLDVLDTFPVIRICIAYRYRDKLLTEFPENLSILKECEPQYIEMPGWMEDLSSISDYNLIPTNARAYLAKLEEITGVKQSLIAVGPKRSQTIVKHQVFD